MACQHENLRFGSGDFYVFCCDCRHRWATIAYKEGAGDQISPEDANQGYKTDGQIRSIPPNKDGNFTIVPHALKLIRGS